MLNRIQYFCVLFIEPVDDKRHSFRSLEKDFALAAVLMISTVSCHYLHMSATTASQFAFAFPLLLMMKG